jgi:hypothetical protein
MDAVVGVAHFIAQPWTDDGSFWALGSESGNDADREGFGHGDTRGFCR